MKREEIRVRDPFLFVEDGKYYMLGTTGMDPWKNGSDLTLYESDDLMDFCLKYTMVTDGSLDGYISIWAPELHKYKGKYYLILSAFREDLGRCSVIFESEKLDEPFKMLTGEYITPAGWGCLDATLFVYAQKPYLCFSNEWTTPTSGDGDGSLFIVRLTDDLRSLADTPRKIVSGKECPISVEIGTKQRGYVAEGPYLYEEDGQIVLLWSTFTGNGYTIIKSVSKNGIYGEYVLEKVLFDQDGGHCMRFIDLEGNQCITFHQPNRSPDERMQILSIQNDGTERLM